MLTTVEFFERLVSHYKNKLPFVSFAKPLANEVYFRLQENDVLHEVNDFTESGFVFAPFNTDCKTVLFPEDLTVTESTSRIDFEEEPIGNVRPNVESSLVKSRHQDLVQKGIDAINEQQFFKVVLSRKEEVGLNEVDIFSIYKKLLNTYKSAFVYCWFHPEVGLWLGATPERLLKTSGNQFSTMALAGTQTYQGTLDVEWQKKETEEQQFVTDFLIDNLKPLVESLNVSGPTTVKAGNLLHLQTNVSARLNSVDNSLQSLIQNFHPTPATCGLPKNEAKAFILENETYNREYYTGFLGEINIKTKSSRNRNRRNVENNAYSTVKNETQLFVNLRCMQVKNNTFSIYIGGGITKDSNPESEWFETVNKAKTMKNVLK